jgi:hypothetical protein
MVENIEGGYKVRFKLVGNEVFSSISKPRYLILTSLYAHFIINGFSKTKSNIPKAVLVTDLKPLEP